MSANNMAVLFFAFVLLLFLVLVGVLFLEILRRARKATPLQDMLRGWVYWRQRAPTSSTLTSPTDAPSLSRQTSTTSTNQARACLERSVAASDAPCWADDCGAQGAEGTQAQASRTKRTVGKLQGCKGLANRMQGRPHTKEHCVEMGDTVSDRGLVDADHTVDRSIKTAKGLALGVGRSKAHARVAMQDDLD